MNFLLDTHAWLWMMIEPKKIGRKTRLAIGAPEHTFKLSLASAWEIAIKHAAGRIRLPLGPLEYIQTRTQADGIVIFPVNLEHVCAAAALPRHHGDPFDRLLVAQAQLENLILMTHDAQIAKYEVRLMDPSR
jgi:PIN domain nuclease of toxin-antitoxin system